MIHLFFYENIRYDVIYEYFFINFPNIFFNLIEVSNLFIFFYILLL
jgi:hypothetical protein